MIGVTRDEMGVQEKYPDGWDYLYWGVWRYMQFSGDPLGGSDPPYTKELPHQAIDPAREGDVTLDPDLAVQHVPQGVFHLLDVAVAVIPFAGEPLTSAHEYSIGTFASISAAKRSWILWYLEHGRREHLGDVGKNESPLARSRVASERCSHYGHS
jgi:hypothetical protein